MKYVIRKSLILMLMVSALGLPAFTPAGGGPSHPSLFPFFASALSPGNKVWRVSVTSNGLQGNNQSVAPFISSDGRYVAFSSSATNLIGGDTNSQTDAFVHDRQTGETVRVSVASDSTQGNSDSWATSISANGRYAVFFSSASNLVTGDTNNREDVFVHDRQTGQTSRVSVASDGTQGNGDSRWVSISAGGQYVAFASYASNLVSGDTNGVRDVFVHDRQTGQTNRVSVALGGAQGNGNSSDTSISADGRYVAFGSEASNLVSEDTNGVSDVFVHDRQTDQTDRISVASDSSQGNALSVYPSISADGRYVAFTSRATNLVSGDTNGWPDIFVHDRQTGQTVRVSVASDGTQGDDEAWAPSISADGRYVAFNSVATNLVDGDSNYTDDIFVHDLQTGQTRVVSLATDGAWGNGMSTGASISSDGRYVAFESVADNLVVNDTNGTRDVFFVDTRFDIYLPLVVK